MTEGAGAPALTSAEAIGEALIRLGTRRIGLVSPYSDAVIGRAKHYYESRFGLTVAAMEGFGATDAYAIGALSADHATEAFARGDRADIQAWVVPGGNFPTMRFVAGWERALGKPVITTNQAILWAAMRAMNAGQPLPGLGRLLEQGFG
jgi:maleate cis-trans isomerase